MTSRLFTPDVLLSLPRVSDLRLAPDGRSLVFVVARQSIEHTKYVSDLHRIVIDERGQAGIPERITVGESNDTSPRFLPDGSLAFLSAREDNDPETKPDDASEPTAQIWLVPTLGEPRPLTRRALAIDALEAAGKTLAFTSYVFPGAKTDDENRERQKSRKESAVSMLEFDALPFRFWDRFHGPRYRHLFAARLDDPKSARDLTPGARLDVDEQSFDVSRDGAQVVVSVLTIDDQHRFVENLVLYDVQTGNARALTTQHDSFTFPRFSPDGTRIACVFHRHEEGKQGRTYAAVIDVATGKQEIVSESLDLWPTSPSFSPDGRTLYFTADERGEVPIFAIDLATKAHRRVARGGGFSDLSVSPDGQTIYALYSTWDRPPEVVACDARATDGAPRKLTRLSEPMLAEVELGRVERLVSKSPDGREVESFFVHAPKSPGDAAKKPLVLWVHGGPVGAWSNHWHFRWNAHVFAARGYHVLLPNPRISLGYGQAFLEEGFNKWGAEPFHDLMSAVDEACKRSDVDASRVAAMGGSFGGYMVNWIAGQTTRFACIVSHAGLYNLPAFHGTTDAGGEWEREFGNPYTKPENFERWSPHRFITKVKTPTLVVHGEKDYRVPVSEAYMFFTSLQRNGVPSKLLYFPDENHWILKPQNSAAWHHAIFDWLDRWLRPAQSP